MSRTGLFQWSRSLKAKASPHSRRRKSPRAARRLRLEPLEDRRLLALGDLLRTVDSPTPAPLELFGSALALSGNYLVVGDSRDGTVAANAGAAYVYDATTGNLLQTLNNPNPSQYSVKDGFGRAVGLSGNYVVVGAHGEEGVNYPLNYEANAGRAYVFDATTGALVHTLFNPAQVNPPTVVTFGAAFGISVAVSGTKAVIGASYSGTTGAGDQSGDAYLFDVTTGALLRSFAGPTSSDEDYFGDAVAIDGNYIVIGAPQDDTGASNAGTAYLYDATTGQLLQTFVNPAPVVGDKFGSSVAVSGNRILVGAPEVDRPDLTSNSVGAAYLYDATTGALLQSFANPDPRDEIGSATNGERFGKTVAINGSRILIGAAGDDNSRGVTYLYDATTGALVHTFTDPTPSSPESFGRAVAISDSQILVSVGESFGRVRVFDAPLPASFVVTSTADSGSGSLRQAIVDANAATNSSSGPDVIEFNLGPGVQTINLAGGLPLITDAVIINGTTGPGGVPLIELSAAGVGEGLVIVANNCFVSGLVINGFSNTGIAITGDGNGVQGNYIGTNAAGTAAVGHGSFGISMVDASNNRVEGNVISGTGTPGSVQGTAGAAVAILQNTGNAQFNTVAGNKIGTSADGTALIPNVNGLFIGGGARNNTIEGNLISGNTWFGVQIAGDVGIPQAFVTSGNVVRGNAITGNYDGVEVGAGPGFVFEASGFTVPTLGNKNNTIQDNIISGNRQYGVVIDGIRADSNFVYDNTIQGNSSYGVAITGGAQGNAIGSAGPLANTISGNGGGGVLLRNLGTEFFPGYDFFIANHPDSPTGSSIVPAINNAIRGNTIFNNTGLAIDLNGDGVTVNDLGDADSAGPNGLQNFPQLLSAAAGAGGLTVTGSLDGAPLTGGLVIDFYASPLPHASGFGGGQSHLGSTTVATDASGRATFTALLPSVAVSQYITAVVTTSAGSSSEFSAAVRVAAEGSGVTPTEENAAPNGGDGNGDGILDSAQDNVASLQNAVSGSYLTLEAPAGTTLAAVQTVTDPSTVGPPPGVNFPVGLVEFALTGVPLGSAQTVTLILPPGTTMDTYYKYGPTAGDPSPHWYEFLYDGVTGAELLSDRVVLHLVDGGRGNDDGLANGTIVDPGSPAVESNTLTTVTAPSAVYGDSVTFTALVSPLDPLAVTPTGSVQFYVDGSAFGSPVSLVDGMASVSLAAPPAGAYSATAVYVSNDADFLASTASAAAVAVVSPATLMVNADFASRAYGGADPAFTATFSGFVLGEDTSVLGGVLAFSMTADVTSPVGTYPLTPGGLSAANYSITFVAGTLTVDPAELTVTADDATKVVGSANPTFTASFAGFVLGQDASVLVGELAFSTPADASSPPGDYPITPGGLAADNYSLIFVEGTLRVTQTVAIEILRSDVNLVSNGVIAVAVFTTANFDAALVDPGSVVFAGAHAVHNSLADVDGDGDLDMVLHFRTQDTNLRALYEQLLADDLDGDGVLDSTHQELDVSLTGQTVDDVFFEGFDELDLFLSGRSLRELLLDLAAAGGI